jgi:ABC-type phosphate transport system permease subunit
MQDTLINRILLCGSVVVVGLVILFCHVRIIQAWDELNRVGMWTGKYTRAGKLTLQAFGALVAVYGVLVILGVIS